MRAFVAGLLLAAVCISPAYGAVASLGERTDISRSISAELSREYYKEANPFGTNAVEIGATVIAVDFYHALADWRSADGKRHGQVFLTTKGCSLWYFDEVSVGKPLTAQELISPITPPKIATELVAELNKLEAEHVAYLKPVTGPTC
jgi:hypothetical protein